MTKLAPSLAFFIAGTGVGLWFLRDRSLRSMASAYAVVIAVLCASLRLDGVPVSIALTAAFVVAAALPSILPLLPDRPIQWQTTGLIRADLRAINWRWAAPLALPAAMILAVALATLAIVTRVYGPNGPVAPDGIPFVDAAGGALAIYLAGLAIVAWLQEDERFREPIAALGLLVTAWAFARALDGAAVVVGWSALVIAGFTLWRELRTIATAPPRVLARPFGWMAITADQLLPGAALLVGGVAALHLMVFELPFVDLGDAVLPAVPFIDVGTIGAASLALAALLVGAIVGGRPAQRASFIAAGAIAAYLVPFEVSLWAVVVLWAGLGVLSTVMARRDARSRRPLPWRGPPGHRRRGDRRPRRGRAPVALGRGHHPGRCGRGHPVVPRARRRDDRAGGHRGGRSAAPLGALDPDDRGRELRVSRIDRRR